MIFLLNCFAPVGQSGIILTLTGHLAVGQNCSFAHGQTDRYTALFHGVLYWFISLLQMPCISTCIAIKKSFFFTSWQYCFVEHQLPSTHFLAWKPVKVLLLWLFWQVRPAQLTIGPNAYVFPRHLQLLARRKTFLLSWFYNGLQTKEN